MHGDRTNALLTDKGNDADAIRAELVAASVEALIRTKSNRRIPIPHDRAKYQSRNLVELGDAAATNTSRPCAR